MVGAGDTFEVGGYAYAVVTLLDGRPFPAPKPKARITRPARVHCGLHKCMTMFQRKIYTKVAKTQKNQLAFALRGRNTGFRHFYHHSRPFLDQVGGLSVASISGQRFDLNSFDDIRVVRFIRDPRDLLVSGYFYHLRGAERWNQVTGPKAGDFDRVNGGIPEGVGPDQTMHAYINALDLQDGLRAEMEFRRPHFLSMMSWDPDDKRVMTVRYEDILGNEPEVFDRIGHHFGWGWIERRRARQIAGRFSRGEVVREGHIRNKAPQQWRAKFSGALNAEFVAEYGPLLRAYGYDET